MNSIRFVDPGQRHVDRCRPAQPDGEVGQDTVQERLDLFPFGNIRIPGALCFERRALAGARESNLTFAIFDDVAPGLDGFKAGCLNGRLERIDDFVFLGIAEILGVELVPCTTISKKPRTAGRQQ